MHMWRKQYIVGYILNAMPKYAFFSDTKKLEIFEGLKSTSFKHKSFDSINERYDRSKIPALQTCGSGGGAILWKQFQTFHSSHSAEGLRYVWHALVSLSENFLDLFYRSSLGY